MRKSLIILISTLILVLIFSLILHNMADRNVFIDSDFNSNMKITSVFEHNQDIPAKYTADGENVNPPLDITDIHDGIKTLALIIEDPDAPAGTWVHWLLWNIPALGSSVRIEENSAPQGAVRGLNNFKKLDYSGPSPPSGTHRYFFKVYALDAQLDLQEGATKQQLKEAMQGHIIDKVELIGLYSKK